MAWMGTAPRSPRHALGIGRTPGQRANAPSLAGEGQLHGGTPVARWDAEAQSRPWQYHTSCPASCGDAGWQVLGILPSEGTDGPE